MCEPAVCEAWYDRHRNLHWSDGRNIGRSRLDIGGFSFLVEVSAALNLTKGTGFPEGDVVPAVGRAGLQLLAPAHLGVLLLLLPSSLLPRHLQHPPLQLRHWLDEGLDTEREAEVLRPDLLPANILLPGLLLVGRVDRVAGPRRVLAPGRHRVRLRRPHLQSAAELAPPAGEPHELRLGDRDLAMLLGLGAPARLRVHDPHQVLDLLQVDAGREAETGDVDGGGEGGCGQEEERQEESHPGLPTVDTLTSPRPSLTSDTGTTRSRSNRRSQRLLRRANTNTVSNTR